MQIHHICFGLSPLNLSGLLPPLDHPIRTACWKLLFRNPQFLCPLLPHWQHLHLAVATVTSMGNSSPSLMQYRPLISLSLSTSAQASKLQSSPWKLAGELKKNKIIKAYRVMQSLCSATHWVLALGSLQAQGSPAQCEQRPSCCSACIQTQISAFLAPISLSSQGRICSQCPDHPGATQGW